ncbi:hypothetical protein HNP46_005179 [Pseudomonas nitritireducens]|uniref:Response regulatory domain-containing protein n=1 Tax=Pseudomonas nitroreducens TaxID=46680 RepID=A0A7W7KPQ7_PSENT|nr:hypothetical protein [Pseudomonas nitritireducens]MBB4866274.1 hypothetical protein [Pseudomonas nitritireducens]
MRRVRDRIAILSESPGTLLEYARVLNDLEYYSISLFGTESELIDSLERGDTFRVLIVDSFSLKLHSGFLASALWYGTVASVALVADANSSQRQALLKWSTREGVPLLGILQAPLRAEELRRLVELM